MHQQQYRPMSACAVYAGQHGSKMFICESSVRQRTSLERDSVSLKALSSFSTMFPLFSSSRTGQNRDWFIQKLTHSHTITPWVTSLLKTLWEKEKLLVTSNFSFSQCFLPAWVTFCHFLQI